MRIRPAVATDAEAIRTIYNAEVVGSETTTFDLVPRTPGEQVSWLARHQGAHPAVVAVAGSAEDEVVLGFGALSVYRTRPAYSTTVENSVYVDRDHRGKGVGRAAAGGTGPARRLARVPLRRRPGGRGERGLDRVAPVLRV